MISLSQKIVRLLQIMRIEFIFSAISNVWLMIFLAWFIESGQRARPLQPAWSLGNFLGLGAAVAAGLSIYAMALNDALDARHDRAFSPHRPIAAGAIGQRTAFGIGVLGLLVAVLASLYLGNRSALLCVMAGAAILFYNIAGKFFPALGILLVGLIRADIMFLPFPSIEFAWPIWLTMTHVTAAAAVVHVLEGKRPRLHGAGWWVLGGGWAFCTLVLGTWMSNHEQAAPGLSNGRLGLWLGPVIAVALFVAASWLSLREKMNPIRNRRAAAGAFMRLAMLWLILYDAAWLLGAGFYWAGGVLLSLFVAAWGAVRIVAALDHIVSPPVSYQIKPTTG